MYSRLYNMDNKSYNILLDNRKFNQGYYQPKTLAEKLKNGNQDDDQYCYQKSSVKSSNQDDDQYCYQKSSVKSSNQDDDQYCYQKSSNQGQVQKSSVKSSNQDDDQYCYQKRSNQGQVQKSSNQGQVQKSDQKSSNQGQVQKSSVKSSDQDKHCEATCALSEDGITNICGTDKKLYPIMDPRLNLKEITKNLLLLEDHLFHQGMRCKDCISKHTILASAYASEAVSLDKERKYSEDINNAIKNINKIHKDIVDAEKKGNLTDEDCNRIAQDIRKIRKPLCQKYGSFQYE
jgi:hypothetical protein